MKKYSGYMIGFISLAFLVPMISSADTVSDMQSQIQALLGQVQVLQNQIRMMREASSSMEHASTTPTFTGDQNGEGDNSGKLCVPLMRNISEGSRGDDVREIQKMLATDKSIFTGSTTGFFGKETARAMAKFQAKFGIASSTTGFVGPITRRFFAKRCSMQMLPQAQNGQGGENGQDNNKGMMGSTTATSTGNMMQRGENR